MREDEIDRIKEQDKKMTKGILEKEAMINELERKIKHNDKKYEKQISKLNNELNKLKKNMQVEQVNIDL